MVALALEPSGSILVGLGSLLVLLGVLRLLQTETAVFRGDLSWLPYLIVLLLALAEMAVMGWRILSGPAKRRRTARKKELHRQDHERIRKDRSPVELGRVHTTYLVRTQYVLGEVDSDLDTDVETSGQILGG